MRDLDKWITGDDGNDSFDEWCGRCSKHRSLCGCPDTRELPPKTTKPGGRVFHTDEGWDPDKEKP